MVRSKQTDLLLLLLCVHVAIAAMSTGEVFHSLGEMSTQLDDTIEVVNVICTNLAINPDSTDVVRALAPCVKDTCARLDAWTNSTKGTLAMVTRYINKAATFHVDTDGDSVAHYLLLDMAILEYKHLAQALTDYWKVIDKSMICTNKVRLAISKR